MAVEEPVRELLCAGQYPMVSSQRLCVHIIDKVVEAAKEEGGEQVWGAGGVGTGRRE